MCRWNISPYLMTIRRVTKTIHCLLHFEFLVTSPPLRYSIFCLPVMLPPSLASFLPLPNHPSAFQSQLIPFQRRAHPPLGLDLRRQSDPPRHRPPHPLLPLLRLQRSPLLHLLRPPGTHRRHYCDQQEAQVPLRTGLRRRGPRRRQYDPQAQE